MQYFIAIVPPDNYKEKIAHFRNRWASNRLRDVVEPHITVKAQSGLTEDLRWLGKVRTACSSFPSFRLTLSEPASFGTAVAFLRVESNEIYELHKRLVEAVSPPSELIKRYYEWDLFHPHLTLGQTSWGMSEAEIEEMKIAAKEALAPFPAFEVRYVRVYREVEPNRYEPFEDMQLADNRGEAALR